MDKLKFEIENIKEKLHNNCLSILVGSGFSKNANQLFPSWDELLEDMIIDIFYDDFLEYKRKNKLRRSKKLIQKQFCSKLIKKYGYLDLVEIYIKQKGYREAITFYIEDRLIPIDRDEKNLDLSIHKALLNLPWNNIYTTNYDTIIEKACNDLGREKEFTTVDNAQKLSIGIQKRIIKLHGNLRTSTDIKENKFGFDGDKSSQYIISKKDYEDYPEKHSAFTHLMCIALLQESFCLIGFSGKDPNFIQWINWVKEILKDKNDKVYLIDIESSECSREQTLFYKNYGIKHIPLKKIFGEINSKDLISKFLDEIKTPTNRAKQYYQLWEKLKKSTLLSDEFYNLIYDIQKKEKHFKIPNYNIYSKAERIINKSNVFIEELRKEKSANKRTEILGILALILRNSYYNLTAIFESNKIEELVTIFNQIEYNKMKGSNKIHWLSFSLCLLRDHRYCLNKKIFDELLTKILSINDLNTDVIDEVKYEQAILSLNNLNFPDLIQKLDNWHINENSSGWSHIRKAMLMNIVNLPRYKEDILHLANKSISKTNVDQEKLWFYEILCNYDISINITQNAYYNAQIDLLKSKGHYSLENIIKDLSEDDSKNKIIPQEDKRYTLTYSLGLSSGDTVNWKYIKFIELIFKAGIPLVPNIKHPLRIFSSETWWKIFKDIKTGMSKEVLALSIQYSVKDADEKFICAIAQNLIFDKKISNKTKSEIFNNLSESFFYLYKNQNSYRPAFIFILSEFVKCLDYDIWKDYITKVWELQLDDPEILNQFYTTIWGISNAIVKILPFIQNNDLLNSMLQQFYKIKIIHRNDNIERTALKYIEKIILHNSFFKLLDFNHKEIKKTMKKIILKKGLTHNNLIKIYYYNFKLSYDLKKTIKRKLLSIELSNDLILYWNELLELTDNKEKMNKKIREYIKTNDQYIFKTGISSDGKNRSFGGLNFNISKTLNQDSSESHLNWTDEEIIRIYSILKRSLGLLKKFNSRKSFFPGLDDEEILNDMFVFLKSTSKILKEEKGYHKTIIKVKGLLSQYEIDDVSQALISNDANYIQKAIIKLYHHLKDSPATHNKMEWLTLLMKIIKREEPKLELAIEYFEYILTEIIKEETWIRDYSEFYLKILKVYYQNSYEELDRIHIEYHLIKVAFFLKNQLGLKDSIIDYWIKIKEESKFQKIKQMDL